MMKRVILLAAVILTVSSAFSQQVVEADRLVQRGIVEHDAGNFEGAISLYDSALLLDKDHLDAMAEKAMSLLSMGRTEDAMTMCERTIDKHKGQKSLRTVYVTYGNAYDAAGKPGKALDVYEEGIKQFPDYYQLHFNKGITLVGQEKVDESIVSFQRAVELNPEHAGSHNAIARLMSSKNQRIPSVLAYVRFLVVEPRGRRAAENLSGLQTLLKGNVTKNGKKNVTITLDPSMLGAASGLEEKKANDFSSQDLILSMSAAMDYDKKYKNEKPAEYLERKLSTICSSMAETRKDNVGFYWDYYASYFIALEKKEFVATLVHVILSGSGDQDVLDWLQKHEKEVADFQSWSKNFAWTTNK